MQPNNSDKKNKKKAFVRRKQIIFITDGVYFLQLHCIILSIVKMDEQWNNGNILYNDSYWHFVINTRTITTCLYIPYTPSHAEHVFVV